MITKEIPYIDITRFEDGFIEAWQNRVLEVSRKAAFIDGDYVRKLEYKLENLCNVNHSICCANGTDAIQLALRAVGVGVGDIVLIPDITFWATFEAVVNCGAKVVTVDVSTTDGGLDLSAYSDAIEKMRPKAAILAHLYGWGSAKLRLLRKIAKAKEVCLIEDGAQSFGTQWCKKPLFSEALISTTSFYPAKVLGAAGDAGAVFTNDKELAERVRTLANHGRLSSNTYIDAGWNSRMDNLQAAYLDLSLAYLNDKISSRQKSAAFYRQHISKSGLKVMDVPTDYHENGYCNVLLIEDQSQKCRLEQELSKNKISFRNTYKTPISKEQASQNYILNSFDNGVAAKFCGAVLNLPLFPYMTEAELTFIVNVVNK